MSNTVAELLAASNGSLANAKANTGEGFQGEWPPAGLTPADFMGVTFTTGEFKTKTSGSFPCLEVTFDWEAWNDVDADPTADPAWRLPFSGARMQLLPNYENVLVDNDQEKPQIRARIEWERFKGHASKLLDISPDQVSNMAQTQADLEALANGETITSVVLNINYDTRNGKTYKTEFVSKLRD